MADDPTEDRAEYDESVHTGRYVWPPERRRLPKQKCPECGGPLIRVCAEYAVLDWCTDCDGVVEH